MGSFFDDFLDDQGATGFEKVMMIGIPLFIAFVFVLFVCAFAFGIARALVRWNRNNNSPLVSTPASVVSKRNRVSGGSGDSSASTSYFVTFEIQGGERLEFHLAGTEFGMLVERDRGTLSYQGTRYKGFQRTPQDR